jgi:hypothetical protein
MRFPTAFYVLAVSFLFQGCVVFPYPTPEVEGLVIDASTKRPVADARVEVHSHSHIRCLSTADGSFDLPTGSAWRPCFLMPGDVFVIWADVSFKAHGYQTVTERFNTLANAGGVGVRPIVLEQPIELQKETRHNAK